jgi:hypothetical protein
MEVEEGDPEALRHTLLDNLPRPTLIQRESPPVLSSFSKIGSAMNARARPARAKPWRVQHVFMVRVSHQEM